MSASGNIIIGTIRPEAIREIVGQIAAKRFGFESVIITKKAGAEDFIFTWLPDGTVLKEPNTKGEQVTA